MVTGVGPAHRAVQTLAWTIMWSGFVALVVMAVLLASGARWFVETATTDRPAEVIVIGGTVLHQEPGQANWETLRGTTSLKQGASLRTVETSEALVRLHDGSTVRLFPNTEVGLTTSQVGRFDPARVQIAISPRAGRARLGIAPSPAGIDRILLLRTPGGEASLSAGQYNLSVTGQTVTLNVQEEGRAESATPGGTLVVGEGGRLVLAPGATPAAPTVTREQLLVNGEFQLGLDAWRAGNIIGFRPGQDIEGTVEVVPIDGRQAVHFVRSGSRGTHNEAYITQPVRKDVSDLTRLTLTVEARLLNQSLSGGGYEGSEYPVKLRLNYTTAAGTEHFKVWGFYYQNDANNRTDSGTQLKRNEWVTYTVPENVMGLLPTPAQITSIQVSASGHDFESYVSRIILVGD